MNKETIIEALDDDLKKLLQEGVTEDSPKEDKEKYAAILSAIAMVQDRFKSVDIPKLGRGMGRARGRGSNKDLAG